MKRGPKPKGQVQLKWSSQFAYAIGLLTADGCLSKDGRHIDFTSADRSLVVLFKKCLALTARISPKKSGSGNISFHIQFGDVLFYRFLLEIGLTPAKSKTLSRISIPDEYFRDFLRGYFDGDGSSYSYYDPIFPRSFRFYISFTTASRNYADWLKDKLRTQVGVKGHLGFNKNNTYIQLKYAKKDAIQLCLYMYLISDAPRLKRKYLKIQRSMRIIHGRRDGEIGKHASFRS